MVDTWGGVVERPDLHISLTVRCSLQELYHGRYQQTWLISKSWLAALLTQQNRMQSSWGAKPGRASPPNSDPLLADWTLFWVAAQPKMRTLQVQQMVPSRYTSIICIESLSSSAQDVILTWRYGPHEQYEAFRCRLLSRCCREVQRYQRMKSANSLQTKAFTIHG